MCKQKDLISENIAASIVAHDLIKFIFFSLKNNFLNYNPVQVCGRIKSEKIYKSSDS